MNRREVLLGSGVALSASLAGCSSASETRTDDGTEGDNEDSESENDDDSPIEFRHVDGKEVDQWPDGDEPFSIFDAFNPDEPLYDIAIVEGDSSAVTDEIALDDGLTAFVYEHESNRFVVNLEGETEEEIIDEFVVADESRSNRAATAVPTSAGEYSLNVDAPDDWRIIMGQLSTPEDVVRTPPVECSGDGSDLIGPVEVEQTPFDYEDYDHDHDGSFGFTVRHETDDGESGTDFPDIVWLDIESDGEWTIKF